ncbi:DUF3549 family protein [Reinekea thalattae]|uniref:DUF3549 family protein n=1 Tax=Reinekea thalattae TaxID=2593301 RepID=A0A5C8Z9H2_9GAMM|nr:DUF3549 family protein [Reinekea thalattae]TXR53929.1 DUF3549 family protein [Reinekea thalattae]
MNAPSLSGFLSLIGTEYQLFDLGVQVRRIPKNTLEILDHGFRYPQPHLGFAWLAIFTWQADALERNNLWFLKLPLDEQGCLLPAVHGELVRRLYQAIQTKDNDERRRLLSDHGFQFTPDNNKMAAMHSAVTHQLNLPASPYLAPAMDYFLQTETDIDWTKLGLQGLSDLVERCLPKHEQQLIDNLEKIEDAPLIALVNQMQHRRISEPMALALCDEALRRNIDELTEATLRGISQAENLPAITELFQTQLAENSISLESLLILITYYPKLFKDIDFACQRMTQLSTRVDRKSFSKVLTNLAMQDELDGLVIKILSSATLTEPLANALSDTIKSAAKK